MTRDKESFFKEELIKEGITFIYNEEDDEYTLIKDDVRDDWVRLGEGYCGDYDPDDPEDEELLRFDIYVLENGQWEAVPDASYCTLVPVTATEEEKVKLLKIILDNYYDALHDRHYVSVKKLGERLSWISLKDLNPDTALNERGA